MEVVIQREMEELPERPNEPRVIQRRLDDIIWTLMEDCWRAKAADRPKIDEVIERMNRS